MYVSTTDRHQFAAEGERWVGGCETGAASMPEFLTPNFEIGPPRIEISGARRSSARGRRIFGNRPPAALQSRRLASAPWHHARDNRNELRCACPKLAEVRTLRMSCASSAQCVQAR